MTAMTLAFAVAGVSQVVLERRAGMDFLTVQKEVEVHFIGLILAASLFTAGIAAFVWNFIRYGLPNAPVKSNEGRSVTPPEALPAVPAVARS